MTRPTAVLLPGFNGSAQQPMLLKLEKRLVDFDVVRLAPPRLKLSPALAEHVAWLRDAVAEVRGPLVLVGRSFGGRLAVRLAAERPLAAVVLLGFPLRPPGKPRPLDEAALAALRCPTLIVQGTRDELGPLKVFSPILSENRALQLQRVEGAGHSFGAKEKGALDAAAAWLKGLLPLSA